MALSSTLTSWQADWKARYLRYRLLLRLLRLRVRLRRKLLVVCRNVGLGDVIETLPACRHLALKYPDRQLVYVTHPLFTAIPALAGLPMIVLADLQAQLPSVARLFFPFYRPYCADDQTRPPSVSLIDDFARTCEVTLDPGEKPNLHLPPETTASIEEEARKLAAGRPLIALHTGPTAKVKEWPRAEWARLVTRLQEEFKAVVVQLGVDYHTNWGESETALLPHVHSLLNKLSLPETACWIRACDCLIGIDSGLVHLALAVDTPAVLICGPTDMFRFRPDLKIKTVHAVGLECLGCHHRTPRLHWNTGCPFDILCMQLNHVDTVVEATRGLFMLASSTQNTAKIPPVRQI